MTLIKRFSTLTQGGLCFIGNSLGLSKAFNENNPGTLTSTGAFTTMEHSNKQGNWTKIIHPKNKENITLNWTKNSSYTLLSLPLNSEIIYAELIWGGSIISKSRQNLLNLINTPISLTINMCDCGCNSFTISPDPITQSKIFTLDGDCWYTNSADITTLINQYSQGNISVGGIVATNDPLNNESNGAGWTIAIIYSNKTLPTKNISLYAGSEFIDVDNGGDIDITGFSTPKTGNHNGKLFLSSLNGKVDKNGDQVLIGKLDSSLTSISGPNNPINNFFGSQINDDSGKLSTIGTFGTRNHDIINEKPTLAARQGWDITTIDISSYLDNNQENLLVRFKPGNDSYLINSLGIEIDV